mgnify:CR=1 FL=1|jgi:hypothetical protein
MCSCGCKSEYYGVCVDHFSGFLQLKPFAKKEQGPVAVWFQEAISMVNDMDSAYPHAVRKSSEMMVDISQENKDEFLNKVVGYKHSVAACNSVSMASTSRQLRQAKHIRRFQVKA